MGLIVSYINSFFTTAISTLDRSRRRLNRSIMNRNSNSHRSHRSGVLGSRSKKRSKRRNIDIQLSGSDTDEDKNDKDDIDTNRQKLISTILLVQEHSMTSKLLRRVFINAGYNLYVVSTLSEAMKSISVKDMVYDTIIIDVVQFDTATYMGEIKDLIATATRDKGKKSIPFILALIDDVSAPTAKEVQRVGFHDMTDKPFRYNRLWRREMRKRCLNHALVHEKHPLEL
jgi:PleD family two-component response regulator